MALILSVSGCSLITKTVYVPSDDCELFLKDKNETIGILLEELNYKDEELRDCLDKLE